MEECGKSVTCARVYEKEYSHLDLKRMLMIYIGISCIPKKSNENRGIEAKTTEDMTPQWTLPSPRRYLTILSVPVSVLVFSSVSSVSRW